MITTEEHGLQVKNPRSLLPFPRSRPIKLGSWGLDRRSSFSVPNGDTDGDCRICATAGDVWVRHSGAEGSEFVGQIGGFSHESEHDLAVMVSDFLEEGPGSESRYSSDSDSGFPDPKNLVNNVLILKGSVEQSESALSSSVQSLLLSINDADLLSCIGSQCNGGCIRQSLVKLLRLSGYDAAVCQSKWQGFGKVPGGDHEYIAVLLSCSKTGNFDRLIIELDFRSHFEIARAVECYEAILNSLPVIYVGSMSKLNKFLQIMVDAAKFSLNQNSMPMPPWRSLPYLQAKWQSDFEKKSLDGKCKLDFDSSDCRQCIGHLRRIKSSLNSEIGALRLLNPITNDKRRMKSGFSLEDFKLLASIWLRQVQ